MRTSIQSMLIVLVTSQLFACSTSYLNDVSHIPHVDLKGDELKRYHNDVNVCQSQVMRLHEGKSDLRNQDREFRACLINKGYMLLS